ncbi:type II toxin-antitoxin system MqsA family antitoxin (plasmid) [Xylella taiwanensis]|uniref:Type II toxin-antitoxin system MqsA family antitoxin n=1 Tax=Xylella taiwanensis TaxID=1444770 RepID=A0ABS8TYS3_9GAMM|nr:type II toxin-antitoxin system MqsA family antitoxin [Xylella taiwanensis]MCD8459809.1 type II toxin-antitoxin system MqsA family antitoxin [Xylella taiwanensis]MCD8474199.1 type II toxin-antitoxin system MqsA family antitoxin [Xylella taiwanensis]UFN08038.1 type II toxin-antitoxin system MqsA family antitoxin [Xylella taiwanensis]UFN10331.1 type II toxin-antitoxin system MqsA family antitoxin [Xylella taiwanensis]UFN12619.1 type II toxin-antitoxin system MqsA family antitoxin [Xylella taiw
MTMKCPCCGAAELIHDTRDMPYTFDILPALKAGDSYSVQTGA